MGWWSDTRDAVTGAVSDAWNDYGRDFVTDYLAAPFYPLGTALRLGYEYLGGLLDFEIPQPEATSPSYSPSYGYGFPATVDAQGRPRQLILGRPLAAALTLYESRDLDATDHLLGWGSGPLAFVPHPTVNGVPLADLPEAWASSYPGLRNQHADPRSAHVRHLEPSGSPVSLTVWDLDTHGAEPTPGSLTQTSPFTVNQDDARVRVHVKAGLAGSGAKELRCTVSYRLSGAGGWTGAGTYTLSLPERVNGTVTGYLVLAGGTAEASAPAAHDFDPDTLTLEFSKEPGYRGLVEVTDAVELAAGSYELRLAFEDQTTGGSPTKTDRGTLVLEAVEVEEVNAAHAMPWLAYSAVTLSGDPGGSGSRKSFAARPAGLQCKTWDAEASAWRTEWTNNPVWLAAEVASRADGLDRGADAVAWDRLVDEAARCDGHVATLESALTVLGGPYLALQCLERPAGGIASGQSVTLYRAGLSTGVTAIVHGIRQGLTVLRSLSAPYTAQLGDQWQRGSGSWRRLVVLQAVGTLYNLGGGAEPYRDYGGFHLVDDTTGAWRPILHWDTAHQWAVLPRDFAAPPSGTVSVAGQRYRCDLAVDTAADAGEVLREILATCAGDWYDTAAGLWACVAGRPRSPVYTLKPSAMHRNTFEAQVLDPAEAPDHLVVTYRDQWAAGEERSIPLGAPVGRVDHTLDLRGVVWEDQAQRLGYTRYNKPRVCTHAVSVTATHHAAELEPWDVIRVKHPRMGWGYDLSTPYGFVAGWEYLPGLPASYLPDGYVPGREDEYVMDPPAELADDHASVRVMVVLSIQDTAAGRVLELADWSDSIYSDSPGILGPPDPQVVAPDPFAVPDPPTDVVLTYLGDLTADGIWNPEVQVEWIHPAEGAIASWEIYQSLDGGANYTLAATAGRREPVRWKVLGFAGSIQVVVMPVGITGLRPKWADLPTQATTVGADTTAPATPTGLTASFGATAVWTWDPNTESDLDHYRISIDGGLTWQRGSQTRYELAAPGSRSITLELAAVDRSGNASSTTSATATLTAPGTPSAAQIEAEQEWTTFRLSVGSAYTRSAAHTGFTYRYSLDGGSTWVGTADPQGTATFTVPVSAYSGPTLDVVVQAREHDVVGAASWSASKTVTLTRPTADQVDESEDRKWAGESGADKTKTVIDGGLITTGTVRLQDSMDVEKAGITATSTGDTAVRLWAGESYANRTSAPFRVTQGGDAYMEMGYVGSAQVPVATVASNTRETTADVSYYVNPVTGSDSYDGLSATYTAGTNGPLATLQEAIDRLPRIVAHTVWIYLSAHTHAGATASRHHGPGMVIVSSWGAGGEAVIEDTGTVLELIDVHCIFQVWGRATDGESVRLRCDNAAATAVGLKTTNCSYVYLARVVAADTGGSYQTTFLSAHQGSRIELASDVTEDATNPPDRAFMVYGGSMLFRPAAVAAAFSGTVAASIGIITDGMID